MAFDLGGGIGNAIGGFVDTVTDALGINKKRGSDLDLENNQDFAGAGWRIDASNWHKVMGYQFIVTKGTPAPEETKKSSTGDQAGDLISGFVNTVIDAAGFGQKTNESEYFYTLPIPPQNIVVKPIFANKATATVGGVVEEVSDTTFWIISMSGTMGIAPGRVSGDYSAKKKIAGKFRETIGTTGLLSGLTSNINRVINPFASAADALANGDPIGAINATITPALPYSGSAVSSTNNGFSEVKALEKFLFLYHRLKSENPKLWKLQFAMYKTNQMWDVVVKDFNIQQNALNPMLYKYTITLQGWNVTSTNPKNQVDYDRFGPRGDLKPVNTVGLDNMQDRLVELKKDIGIIL